MNGKNRLRVTKLEGFEVKAANMKQPKISRSARSFIDAYTPKSFFIINPNLSAEDKLRKTEIRWMIPIEFNEKGSSPALSEVICFLWMSQKIDFKKVEHLAKMVWQYISIPKPLFLPPQTFNIFQALFN